MVHHLKVHLTLPCFLFFRQLCLELEIIKGTPVCTYNCVTSNCMRLLVFGTFSAVVFCVVGKSARLDRRGLPESAAACGGTRHVENALVGPHAAAKIYDGGVGVSRAKLTSLSSLNDSERVRVPCDARVITIGS